MGSCTLLEPIYMLWKASAHFSGRIYAVWEGIYTLWEAADALWKSTPKFSRAGLLLRLRLTRSGEGPDGLGDTADAVGERADTL